MPNYRRFSQGGGTFFFTMVTHRRAHLFADSENVERLRVAIRQTLNEWPFEIETAVVFPDHAHYLWRLPDGDSNFSKRAGRAKALFTKSLPGHRISSQASRAKHRESDVWQRRFWEHTIRDPDDFKEHLNYIHYNPVKHGYVTCPDLWPYSSFRKWVKRGAYPMDWLCVCNGKQATPPRFPEIEEDFGE